MPLSCCIGQPSEIILHQLIKGLNFFILLKRKFYKVHTMSLQYLTLEIQGY